MVDKTTKVLLIFALIVFMLSLKDLVLIKSTNAAEQSSKASTRARADGGVNLGDEAVPNTEETLSPTAPLEDEHEHNDDEHNDMDESNGDYNEFDVPSQANEDADATSAAASEARLNEQMSFKKIPSLKMKSNIQTIKFMFCYSCGYRNAFEQYSQLIQSRFPELRIIGENYPPAGYKLYLTQFISTFKILVIGCIMFNFNPFAQVNLPTPNVFTWATQNKFYASIMLFFISNSIETHLISTGAFEIYLNDMQIWSKLASDRMPHEKELLQILDMNFNFESEKNAAFGSANSKF